MKSQINREELEEILRKIRAIIDSQKEEKDFIQIREEILTSDSMKNTPKLTKEELEEIFRKYDKLIFKGEYSKFLNVQKFKTMILNWIRSISPNYKLDKNKIKEEVGKRIAEFDANDKEFEEDIEEILNNYDLVFTELMPLTKGESLIVNALKEEFIKDPHIIYEKDKIKQQLKSKIKGDTIRRIHFSGENKFTREVEKILKNYELIFDWTYDNFIKENSIKNIKQMANNGLKKDSETSRKTMETIHQKRETFLASIKQQIDDTAKLDSFKQRADEEIKGDNLKRKEENPKEEYPKQLAYMTIKHGTITGSYNPPRHGTKKEGQEKTIKIFGFLNQKKKARKISYPTKEGVVAEEQDCMEGDKLDSAWEGR